MKLSDMHRPEVEPVKLPRGSLWRHAVILLGAIAITVAVFEFWGDFASAWGNFMSLPPPAAPVSGPVTVQIIPSKPPPKKQP